MRKIPFPVWILVIIGVVILVEKVSEIEVIPDKVSSQRTCKGLSPRIIKLSKERNTGIFNRSILKMYEIEEISSEGTDRTLNCLARVKWNRGGETKLNFYLERDEDGDTFIGYRMP